VGAAKSLYSNPEDQLPWQRLLVAEYGLAESVIYEGNFTARNIREQVFFQWEAQRLQLEIDLYKLEVAAKKATPEVETKKVAIGQPPRPAGAPDGPMHVVGHANEPVGRKVQKLKDGRLTAYPEFVYDVVPGEKPGAATIELPAGSAAAIEDLVNNIGNIPEKDIIRNLMLEQVRSLLSAIKLDDELIKAGTYNFPVLNQHIINFENLVRVAKAMHPKPEDQLPWQRSLLAEYAKIERVAYGYFAANQINKSVFLRCEAHRLQLEIELYELEVIGQPPRPAGASDGPMHVAGQANEPVVRKIQKVKEGRLTAYPEFAFGAGRGTRPNTAAIEKLATNIGTIPETEIQRHLMLEQVRKYLELVKKDHEVLEHGSYDIPYLNQYIINLENLVRVAKSLNPTPEDQLPWQRLLVAEYGLAENVIYERVFVGQVTRKSVFFQWEAQRLQLEIELHDLEVVAKKASPVVGTKNQGPAAMAHPQANCPGCLCPATELSTTRRPAFGIKLRFRHPRNETGG
jgi:hypothetical protein